MKKPPSNISHLNRLIDAWHQDAPHITSGRLRRLIGVTALVGLLDDLSIDDQPRLAIKGGAALVLRFGPEARATSDVDAVTNIGLDQAFVEIADRLERGWMGFTGQLGDRTDIVRAGISPLPKRAKIKVLYKDKSFITLPFELGWAESESFSRTESIRSAIDLVPAQLPSVGSVNVLGVEYQIAQKLHACTEIPSEGTNQRVHDLYDICILMPLLTDFEAASAAALDTFMHREKHAWPPELTIWPDWPKEWEALGVPEVARIDFAEAVEEVERLVRRIDQAGRSEVSAE